MMKVTHPHSSMRSQLTASTPPVMIGQRDDASSPDLFGGCRKSTSQHALGYMRVFLNLLAVQHMPAAIMLKYMQIPQLAKKALPSLLSSRVPSIQTKKKCLLMEIKFIRGLELPKMAT